MDIKTTRRAPGLLSNESVLAVQGAQRAGSLDLVFVTSHGRILLDEEGKGVRELRRVKADELDLEGTLDLYVYGDFVALAESNGVRALVLRSDDPAYEMPLRRGEYHVKHCVFPLGFFERGGEPHLVHATDWNRLDVTHLISRDCLTERVVRTKPEPEINYMDYFHSGLCVSPSGATMIGNGWHWQPFDARYAWNIDTFLERYEPSHVALESPPTDGYIWNRPLCFIDETTIAWVYNRSEDDEIPRPTTGAKFLPSELICNDVRTGAITDRIEFDFVAKGDDNYITLGGQLHFVPAAGSSGGRFITFSQAHDLTVTDHKGECIGQAPLRPVAYVPSADAFLGIEGAEITVTTVVE